MPRARDLADTARCLATRCELDDAPQSSLAYTATGAVYAAQGRYEEAVAEFKQAVPSHAPTFGVSPWVALEGMLALAQVLLDMGDGVRAAEIIDDAADVLTLYPDDVTALATRLDSSGVVWCDRRASILWIRSPIARWRCCACSGARCRGTRSGRNLAFHRTQSRPIPRRSTGSSRCLTGMMPSNEGATPVCCDDRRV